MARNEGVVAYLRHLKEQRERYRARLDFGSPAVPADVDQLALLETRIEAAERVLSEQS